jgi:hypothetical protein
MAVNPADDLINLPPPGILEHEIKRVHGARAVGIPFNPETRGHGSHTMATLWKSELMQVRKESAKPGVAGAKTWRRAGLVRPRSVRVLHPAKSVDSTGRGVGP